MRERTLWAFGDNPLIVLFASCLGIEFLAMRIKPYNCHEDPPNKCVLFDKIRTYFRPEYGIILESLAYTPPVDEKRAIDKICRRLEVVSIDHSSWHAIERETRKRIVIGTDGHVRHLDLSSNQSIRSFPLEICRFKALTRLDLSLCSNLKKIPKDTIGHLRNLESLRFVRCDNLKEIPSEIGTLVRLRELKLSRCEKLTKLPKEIKKLKNLQRLDLSRCYGLEDLPSEIGKLSQLLCLDISHCMKVTKLPREMQGLSQLQSLNMAHCRRLKQFPPEIVRGLAELRTLDIGCCLAIKKIPEDVLLLPMLESLRLFHHSQGEAPPPPESMEKLVAMRRDETALFHIKTYAYNRISHDYPFRLGDNGDAVEIRLKHVRKEGTSSSPYEAGSSFPSEAELLALLQNNALGLFPKLETLFISGSPLRQLPPAIGKWRGLVRLNLSHSEKLEELPRDIGNFTSLRHLNLYACFKLKALPREVGKLLNLVNLNLSLCRRLTELPEELVQLTRLEWLWLFNCTKLRRLPTNLLQQLNRLKHLHFKGCPGLENPLSPQEVVEQSYSLQVVVMDNNNDDSTGFEYYKSLNRAGRYLFREEENSVPDALWPLVLSKIDANDFSTMHYFLKTKPELCAKRP